MRWRPIAPSGRATIAACMVRVFGRPGDAVDASGKSRRRACRQSVSLYRLADLRRPRRHRAAPRSRSLGRYAVRDQGAGAAEKSRRSGWRAARAATSSAKVSATPLSIISPTSRRRNSRASPRRPAARPTSPPGSTTSISICFDRRHSGLPRSGKSGIHNHQVSERGCPGSPLCGAPECTTYPDPRALARAYFFAAKCGIT